VEDWTVYVVGWWLRKGGQYDAYLAGRKKAGGQGRARARLAEIDAELLKLTAKWDRLAAKAAASDDLGDFYDAQARTVKAEVKALREERAEAEIASREPEPAARPAGKIPWDRMTPDERRDWLRQYIHKVIIHPAVPGRHWFDLSRVEVVPGAWWPAGKPAEYPAPTSGPPARTCDYCWRPHEAHGRCQMHNTRARRAAELGHPDDWDRSPERRPTGRPARVCELPGCRKRHDGHGLCRLHNERRRAGAKAGRPGEWDRSPARGRPGPAKGTGGRPRKTPDPRT
jgi:hypothetical protein